MYHKDKCDSIYYQIFFIEKIKLIRLMSEVESIRYGVQIIIEYEIFCQFSLQSPSRADDRMGLRINCMYFGGLVTINVIFMVHNT